MRASFLYGIGFWFVLAMQTLQAGDRDTALKSQQVGTNSGSPIRQDYREWQQQQQQQQQAPFLISERDRRPSSRQSGRHSVASAQLQQQQLQLPPSIPRQHRRTHSAPDTHSQHSQHSQTSLGGVYVDKAQRQGPLSEAGSFQSLSDRVQRAPVEIVGAHEGEYDDRESTSSATHQGEYVDRQPTASGAHQGEYVDRQPTASLCCTSDNGRVRIQTQAEICCWPQYLLCCPCYCMQYCLDPNRPRMAPMERSEIECGNGPCGQSCAACCNNIGAACEPCVNGTCGQLPPIN